MRNYQRRRPSKMKTITLSFLARSTAPWHVHKASRFILARPASPTFQYRQIRLLLYHLAEVLERTAQFKAKAQCSVVMEHGQWYSFFSFFFPTLHFLFLFHSLFDPRFPSLLQLNLNTTSSIDGQVSLNDSFSEKILWNFQQNMEAMCFFIVNVSLYQS